MSPDTLARLRKEAEQPAGVAPVIDSPELAQLLEERQGLLEALKDACEPMCDYCRTVGEGRYPQDGCEYGCHDRQQSWFVAIAKAQE